MGKKMGKKKRKIKDSTVPAGEVAGFAFSYWSNALNRFELKIANELEAHTEGKDIQEHEEAREKMERMAEEKGYRVLRS